MSSAAGERAQQLARLAADPRRLVVACDYDGTLAPIVEDPAAALPAAGAIEALVAVADLVGTTAVITGRPALEVVRLASLDRVQGLVVLGVYGDQRWVGGTLVEAAPSPGVAVARDEVIAVVAAAAQGVRLEDKGRSLAVHTRLAADPAQALEDVRAPLAALAERNGLRLEAGRFVLELRPAGGDKGSALRRLAEEAGATAVLFAGDDLGDLSAFAVLRELAETGIVTCAVASASAEVPAVSAAADLVVDGPEGVVALLEELGAAMA